MSGIESKVDKSSDDRKETNLTLQLWNVAVPKSTDAKNGATSKPVTLADGSATVQYCSDVAILTHNYGPQMFVWSSFCQV